MHLWSLSSMYNVFLAWMVLCRTNLVGASSTLGGIWGRKGMMGLRKYLYLFLPPASEFSHFFGGTCRSGA